MPNTTEEAVYEPTDKMKNTVEIHADGYSITMLEACEMISRCPKTLSRYVHKGRITPQRIKSQNGTLEYRFRRDDVESLRLYLREEQRYTIETTDSEEKKNGLKDKNLDDFSYTQEQTGKMKGGQGEQKQSGRTRQNFEIESLLKKNIQFLKEQLATKDNQISMLLERDREKNMLLKGLQDKVMLLDPPKESFVEGKTRQNKKELLRQAFFGSLLIVTLIYAYLSHWGIK
jgi:hypothetical protein